MLQVWRAGNRGQRAESALPTSCCRRSCETQRGEDSDMPHNSSVVFFTNENQGCVAGQTQESNGPDWNVGSYVWTLFDVRRVKGGCCNLLRPCILALNIVHPHCCSTTASPATGRTYHLRSARLTLLGFPKQQYGGIDRGGSETVSSPMHSTSTGMCIHMLPVSAVSSSDAGRPPVPNTAYFIHIVESWQVCAASRGPPLFRHAVS